MLKIGLTGGIGTGKSTVAGIFSALNIPVFNADDVSKELIRNDKGLQDKIRAHFGEESFLPDGTYNTKYIAGIVFKDGQALEQLNKIVHPYVNEYADAWWHQRSAEGHLYAVKEAAILFESNLNAGLDYVIGVDSPPELRISRVQKRDNISRDEVLRRMSRQMDNDEKMSRCDFVVQNDEHSSLIIQVLDIHNKLLQIHQL